MKWRCAWCGKPHERNDPPCDNCGHHKFEKAVVPVAPEDPDHEPAPVWVCPECGREHQKHSPPCSRCGNATLEKRTRDPDEFDELDAPSDPEPDSAATERDVRASETDHVPSPVWVCPECGREHQKNTPPCSRCGHASLEKRTPDYSDLDEIGSTSYLDILEPKYVAGFALAAVAGVALVLAFLGVITLPGMGPGSLDVENVPGEADASNGLDLATVEREYVAELNDRRAASGEAELSRNDRVDEIARYYNQRRVKAAFGNGSLADDEEIAEALGRACDGSPRAATYAVPTNGDGPQFDSETAFAGALVDRLYADSDGFGTVEDGLAGVDVHVAPNGDAYVAAFAC